MCIRDSLDVEAMPAGGQAVDVDAEILHAIVFHRQCVFRTCLLYTSDAADERSSVDLGGRRIIKKKKNGYDGSHRHTKQ